MTAIADKVLAEHFPLFLIRLNPSRLKALQESHQCVLALFEIFHRIDRSIIHLSALAIGLLGRFAETLSSQGYLAA